MRVSPAPVIFAVLAVCAVCLGACDFGSLDSLSQDEPEDATDELTQKARALWRLAHTGSDATIKSALADIDGVIARGGELPIQVRIGPLSKDDVAMIGSSLDPAAAQGLLLVNDIDCSLDQANRNGVARNQAEFYPGEFDSYTRTYTTSIDDYLSGRSPTVLWRSDFTSTSDGITVALGYVGGKRRVRGASPTGGDVLMSAPVLDYARVVKGDPSSSEVTQEYRISVHFEVGPNRVRHFDASWRQARSGGLTSDSDLYSNLVLGGMRDSDVRDSKVCRDGKPVPTF